MQKYKYVLFDLDGTLVMSHPGIFSCIRYALKELGYPEPDPALLPQCVGPSLHYSFSTFFGLSDEEATKATAKYREQYSVTGVYQNEPIEGALECLKALKEKGYRMALATSKPKIYADLIAERFGFSTYLDVQVGPGMDGSLPTKAAVIAEAMRQLGASANECLMVGDRKHDVEGAKLCGVDCVLLKVGYAEEGEERLCHPEYVLQNFKELTAFLTAE